MNGPAYYSFIFFYFDPFRAKILPIFWFSFWEIWWPNRFILNLTDLYPTHQLPHTSTSSLLSTLLPSILVSIIGSNMELCTSMWKWSIRTDRTKTRRKATLCTDYLCRFPYYIALDELTWRLTMSDLTAYINLDDNVVSMISVSFSIWFRINIGLLGEFSSFKSIHLIHQLGLKARRLE